MRKIPLLVSGLLLGLAVACGGSKHQTATVTTAPAATGLSYTNPTSSGWRLVKDASSTSSRLVLNLVGPSGLLSRGAGFNLQAGAIHFGKFDETDFPIKDGGVYELKNIVSPTGNPPEAVLLAGGVKPGNLLTVGAFQKDRTVTAKDSGATLFQIALEFDGTANLSAGDAIPLSITKAKYMAEDIGGSDFNLSYEKIAKARLVDMSIALGTLVAK